MIPKVINYCWFGEKKLPNSVKKNIKSWKKMCPDYEIIEWNESNFSITDNEFLKEAYKNHAWAFVSDYARLKIIYEHGGIYLDTDVEVIRNLDSLLTNKAYVGIQRREKLCATGLGFGAEKHNPVIKKMLLKYENLHFDPQKTMELSCPNLNNAVIKEIGYKNSNTVTYLNDITIYPSKYFDPLSPGYTNDLLQTETYTIHHYNASWLHGKKKLKRQIVNLIGQKKVNYLKKLFEF
ncbi:glycosyltransferase family 32 protein [Limosilactobacillus reuteri subsp. suis]|uniref:glycosyltransferase family 32 protein n=1 Tax=Limosilactobacillus reuteri TaxID=1598 RepID=UPI00128AFFF5|nr:glycosyltransferase [Limosilactobacillus reuteri]MQB68039.1 exopolysaccharide biosynthesis protein [Limosilactobacillus reuteri]